MRIQMPPDAVYLDGVETDALVAALSRRSPAMLVVMMRPGNPDDGADKLSIFFETNACCNVHNCIHASSLLCMAQDQILQRLDQHLERSSYDEPHEDGDLTPDEKKEIEDIFGEDD